MKNLNEYIYLKDLVADCGGIEKFRFFGHLPIRIHSMNPVGIENMRRIIQKNGWTEVK